MTKKYIISTTSGEVDVAYCLDTFNQSSSMEII